MKILVVEESKNDRLILTEKVYARAAYCSSCKCEDEVVAVATIEEGLKALAQDTLSFDIVIATILHATVAIQAHSLGVKKVAIIGKQAELDSFSLRTDGVTFISTDDSVGYLVPRVGGVSAKKWREILKRLE